MYILFYPIIQTTIDPDISQLTLEQQADFKRALVDGRLSEYIEIWEPLWHIKPNPLIQRVSKDGWI